MIKRASPSRQREHGVALVTTVIVVAVLAVVAVAMMQSATLDRTASRSAFNHAQARAAAEAGLAYASAVVSRGSTNDTFIVVANAGRQLFVGNGLSNSTSISYAPLFSVASDVTNVVENVVTNGMPTNTPQGSTVVFTNWVSPGGLSITSPVVGWTYVTSVSTNPAGQSVTNTNARFAFWVEDLSGRLDLSLVGSTNLDTAKRPSGTNPAEIALWRLFSDVRSDPGNVTAASLVGARSNILTSATARLVSSNVSVNNLLDMAAGMRWDTNELELIPFGFGYKDQGKAKYNINTNIGSNGVVTLAQAIRDNIPNFANRAGAMNPVAYVNNIAANIIDYADVDSNPTVDDPGNPSYIGIENLPWPNEIFDRVRFLSVTTDGIIRIELKDWIEVWNMGNRPTAPTVIRIENNYDLALVFTNNSVTPNVSFRRNLNSAEVEAPGNFGAREFQVPQLQPNEYRVIASSTEPSSRILSWKIPDGLAGSSASIRNAWRIFSPAGSETTNMSFRATVGGALIQQTKGGRWVRHLAPTTDAIRVAPQTPNRFIFCNPIGFATQTQPMSAPNAVPIHSGGDPRAQAFLSGALRAANYKDTGQGGYASPGGRNWEERNIARYPESEVNPARFWPDSGHASSADRGTSADDYTQDPDSFAARPNLSNNIVMRRNDSGALNSALELRNVYDPLQWRDQAPTGIEPPQVGIWTNLTSAAQPDARFGGRNTLRIGRWEFSRFSTNRSPTNTNWAPAWQLLDVFAAGPGGTNTAVTNRIAGRVNINTASSNALRALAAGVSFASDPALLPDGANFIVPTNAVSAFATAVLDHRSSKPFYSVSELASISTNSTNPGLWPSSAVFGNSNIAGVTAWNDSAAEEWFTKIQPLATVRSRNFLVHVVGDALQPGSSNNVLARAWKTYQIFVKPIRGTNDSTSASYVGQVTNTQVEIVQSWDAYQR